MKFEFTQDQMDILNKMDLGFDPTNDLTDDEHEELVDIVADYLMAHGFIDYVDYNANRVGDICESIITMLTKDW